MAQNKEVWHYEKLMFRDNGSGEEDIASIIAGCELMQSIIRSDRLSQRRYYCGRK